MVNEKYLFSLNLQNTSDVISSYKLYFYHKNTMEKREKEKDEGTTITIMTINVQGVLIKS